MNEVKTRGFSVTEFEFDPVPKRPSPIGEKFHYTICAATYILFIAVQWGPTMASPEWLKSTALVVPNQTV